MKFTVITTGYPEKNNYYKNAFIHQRVLQYIEKGHECCVLVQNMKQGFREYTYEGVYVLEGDYESIKSYLMQNHTDRILVHFINRHIISLIKELNISVPIIVWIHGIEALSWKRRLFNVWDVTFMKYIISNILKLRQLRRFVISNENVKFIFVSNWMKMIMEKDLKIKVKKYIIIPNVINTDLFNYENKDDELRKKILIIRNFSSRKYANDISTKALLKISRKPYFEDLDITIYGKGKYFRKLTEPLKGYSNINMHEEFLSQKDIARMHKNYGVFLCPTRQDAQGVSMCEAMSSGLVPITSNNTAIPEFVDESSGYLTDNSVKSIVNAIEELYYSPELFKNMSCNSSSSIREKCSGDRVIQDEINYILDN